MNSFSFKSHREDNKGIQFLAIKGFLKQPCSMELLSHLKSHSPNLTIFLPSSFFLAFWLAVKSLRTRATSLASQIKSCRSFKLGG